MDSNLLSKKHRVRGGTGVKFFPLCAEEVLMKNSRVLHSEFPLAGKNHPFTLLKAVLGESIFAYEE